MAFWDSNIRWDSGARFDEGPGTSPIKRMSKIKLEFKLKSDEQIRDYALTHKTSITGNVLFPSPVPTPALFDAALTAYTNKLAAIVTAEQDLQSLRLERDALRTELELKLTARAGYVESTADGDPAKIVTTGFQLVADPTPTNHLEVPQFILATMGPSPGQIRLKSAVVEDAVAYVFECREHPENAAPGSWQQVKISTKATYLVTGLVSGRSYAFRVRALGPKNLESPWSDEAVCMAP